MTEEIIIKPSKNLTGYASLHYRMKKQITKPEFCEICKQRPPTDLSNISGKYLEDLSDWSFLCRKCHLIIDGTINFLTLRNGYKDSKKTRKKRSEALKKNWLTRDRYLASLSALKTWESRRKNNTAYWNKSNRT